MSLNQTETRVVVLASTRGWRVHLESTVASGVDIAILSRVCLSQTLYESNRAR